jgi:molybdopterin synthase catalytic subunit
MFEIVDRTLNAQELSDAVARPEAGGIAVFLGVVRDNNLGRQVGHLVYDAYPEMATRQMRVIADEVRERWPVCEIAMHHRVGRLEIGEASVGIAVSSAHRAQAIEACHYAIDRLKESVPIWKKEVWADGEEWIEGHLVPPPQAEAIAQRNR